MHRFVEQIIHRNEGQENFELLHDEGWITGVAYHVFVAGHLSQKVKTRSLLRDVTTQDLRSQASTVGKRNEPHNIFTSHT
jgi:hypothetical protein